MDQYIHLYPTVIIEDRYNGTYSGGAWFAISRATTLIDNEDLTRAEWCLNEGPNADDGTASSFWINPPSWIAVGNSPQEALAALRLAKGHQR